MSSSSDSAYSPSDGAIDDNDDQDAESPSNSGREGPGQTAQRKGRQPHKTQSRPRQDDPALQGSVSQSRQLVDQPDAVVQPGKGQSSKGKLGQRAPSPRKSRQPKGLKSRSAQPEPKEVKGNYRDLLNSVITEAGARYSGLSAESLFTSRIGASLWTSQEKERLFRRMRLAGRNDLQSLHRAVPTKSESEIKFYLQLLEQESKKSSFDLDDVAAAVEVSEDCEEALESSADILARLVNDHDMKLQQNRFGENWLIDEESAYYIDLVFDQPPESDQDEGEAATERDDEENVDAKPSVPNQDPSIAESDASITLLRPSSFLQLSRWLFMNSNLEPNVNWQSLEGLPESVHSPAIFRGAFEDFHNLTVSLTRRVVQASLFQAMTRLRAEDSSRQDWTPLAAVREVDVRSAVDILGMKSNARDYWAKAPRRCKVDVYTDSKKYQDGRKGTKTGVKLTYDEVEAELGLEQDPIDEVEVDERDVENVMDESDMFTETETEDDVEFEEKEEPKSKQAGPNRSRSLSRKRKRSLSPSSFLRAETKYLNAIDYNASIEDSTRLWKVLRTDPPYEINRKPVKLAEHPGRAERIKDDWRDAVQYEAEWERPLGCVDPSAFVEMERIGVWGRRRREMISDRVKKRTPHESDVGKVDKKRHDEKEVLEDCADNEGTSIEEGDDDEKPDDLNDDRTSDEEMADEEAEESGFEE